MISVIEKKKKKNAKMLVLQVLIVGGHSERGEHRTPIGAELTWKLTLSSICQHSLPGPFFPRTATGFHVEYCRKQSQKFLYAILLPISSFTMSDDDDFMQDSGDEEYVPPRPPAANQNRTNR